MTHIEVSRSKPRVKQQTVDPEGLLISIIRQRSKADRDTQIAAFKQLVLQDDDAIEKIIDAWISLRYSTLLRMASPPTVAEIRRRQSELAEERAQYDKRIRDSFLSRIWELVMPNGKRAHECTFQQVASRLGLLAAAITAAGKDRMNKRIDAVFKSPEAFMAALKRTGHV